MPSCALGTVARDAVRLLRAGARSLSRVSPDRRLVTPVRHIRRAIRPQGAVYCPRGRRAAYLRCVAPFFVVYGTVDMSSNHAVVMAWLESRAGVGLRLITRGVTTRCDQPGPLAAATLAAVLTRPDAAASARRTTDGGVEVFASAARQRAMDALAAHFVAGLSGDAESVALDALLRQCGGRFDARPVPAQTPASASLDPTGSRRHPAAQPVRARGATRQRAAFARMRASEGRHP